MFNKYLDTLNTALRDRYSVESAGMTISDWVIANTTHRGRQFSFDRYQFQRAILDDMHPNLDVLKISQVGLTEIQMRKALAFCVRNPGLVGIFSFPNEVMFRRFFQSRLKPLIEEDRVFFAKDEEVRSMNLLQFGRSFLHVVNATEGSATSISADFLFNDEVDLSDQKVLALFASRLQNSDLKIAQRFSTPTWTGFGIDGSYSQSDQREYMCKCRSCNHWQVPLFQHRWVKIPGFSAKTELFDLDDATILNLPLDESYVVCEKCSAPLDLDDPSREWVAAFPSRVNGRGYRVRPFTTSRIPIAYILRQLVDYRRRDFERGWYNTVLGEGYISARARLDEETIRRNMQGPGEVPLSPGEDIFIGIDVGQICHLVIGKVVGDQVVACSFQQLRVNDLVARVKELHETYNLVCGSCDRHPYTPTADELFSVTSGRVMPIEYRGDKEFNPVKNPADEITHWQANRTKIIDEVAKMIRLHRLPMRGYGLYSGLLVEHLRDMIREEDPEKPAKWVKLNGNDHFFHALAFLVAATRLPGVQALFSDAETRSSVLVGSFKMNTGQSLIGKSIPGGGIR